MKLRRRKALVLLMVTAICVTGNACGFLQEEFRRKDYVIIENSDDKLVMEYDGITYSFINKSANGAKNSIRATEKLLKEVREEYGIRCGVKRIKHVSDFTENMVMRDEIRLTPDDNASLGMLILHQSEGKLPAWLCAGLKMLISYKNGEKNPQIDRSIDAKAWVSSIKAKGLPEFGDAWMIPGLIDDDLAAQFPSVVYAYINYLDKNNVLSDVVSAYLQEHMQGLVLHDASFNQFCDNGIRNSYKNETRMVFQYLYDKGSSEVDKYVNSPSFKVYGKEGAYRFSGFDWTLDYIKELVYNVDDTIRFAKEWYGFGGRGLIPVAFVKGSASMYGRELNGLAFMMDTETNEYGYAIYNCELDYMWRTVHTSAHEAGHVLMAMNDAIPNLFRYAEEGVCSAVKDLYLNDLKDDRYDDSYRELFDEDLSELDYYLRGNPAELYKDFSGKEYTEKPLDYIAFAHMRGYMT